MGALGETARLLASLDLKDGLTPVVKTMSGSLDKLDTRIGKSANRAEKAGRQIGTGIKSGIAIGVGAATAAAGLFLVMAHEGQKAQNSQIKFDQAVKNSGKVTAAYTKILGDQATALSTLTGADDEAIQAVQTMLVTQGLSGEQIQKITPLILAAATQTGRDLESVTLAVGRAVQGSATSLGKIGIVIPKVAKGQKSAALATLEHQKALLDIQGNLEKARGATESSTLATLKQRKAQLLVAESTAKSHGALTKAQTAVFAQKKAALDAAIGQQKLTDSQTKGTGKTLAQRKAALDAAIGQQKLTDAQKKGTAAASGFDTVFGVLNKRFKGVNEALSQQLDTKLKAFNERLQDVRENAGIKLLPVMTRIVDVITAKVIPAFGKFVDQILPIGISALDKVASFLESGEATKAFTSFLSIAQTAVPIMADAADKTFTVIKAAVGLFTSLPPEIQALAVAGLTINKLTGGLVTNLAGGLISAVLSSFKGIMGVTAGIVNVNGPVAGLGGAGGLAGETGTWTKIGKLIGGAFAIVAVAELADLLHGQISPEGGLQGRTEKNKLLFGDTLEWPFGPKNTPHLDLGPFKDILGGDSQFVPLPTPNLPVTTPEQDASEKAQQARNTVFTSTPTRNELRTQIGQLTAAQKHASGENARDIGRHLNTLKKKLQERIDNTTRIEHEAAVAERAQQIRNTNHIVDATNAVERAVRQQQTAQQTQGIVNLVTTAQTIINGRLFDANVSRYSSTFVNGQRPAVGGA